METSKKLLIAGVLVVVLSFGVYAGLTIYNNYKKLKEIRVSKVYKIQYMGTNPQGYYVFRLSMDIENKSGFTLQVKSYDIHAFIGNIPVAVSMFDKPQTIQQQATSKFSFDLFIKPADVLAKGQLTQLVASLVDFKNLKVTLAGYISGSVDGISVEKFPIDFDLPVYDLIQKKLAKK